MRISDFVQTASVRFRNIADETRSPEPRATLDSKSEIRIPKPEINIMPLRDQNSMQRTVWLQVEWQSDSLDSLSCSAEEEVPPAVD